MFSNVLMSYTCICVCSWCCWYFRCWGSRRGTMDVSLLSDAHKAGDCYLLRPIHLYILLQPVCV